MEEINQSSNRKTLLKKHLERVKTILERENHTGPTPTQCTQAKVVDFVPPTPVQLEPENRIYLEDVIRKIGIRQTGKFLVCRTIVMSLKEDELVEVIIEDGRDDAKAALLALDYYDIDEFFEPRGLDKRSIIILKNPWFVNGAQYRHGLGLRSDNPSDVEVLTWNEGYAAIYPEFGRPISSLYLNVLMAEPQSVPNINMKYWRDRGNHFFRETHYFTAIRSYTEGLKLRSSGSEQESVLLFTNRARANLKVGRPGLALKDAEAALNLHPHNTKAPYLKSLALCRTNQHQRALEFMNGCTIPFPPEMKELQNFITNQLDVNSNSSKKWDDTIGVPFGSIYLSHVEYTGPVTIAQTPRTGRGLFATSDIKAGDFILVSRAFEIVTYDFRYDLVEMSKNTYDPYCNPSLSRTCLPSSVQLYSVLANRLLAEPHLRKELYQLFAGSKLGHIDVDEEGSNGDGTGKEPLPLDMERIRQICDLNNKLWFRLFSKQNPITKSTVTIQGVISGIWILPSFINHSCVDINVKSEIRGDFCFVTASKNIKAGEELTSHYCDQDILTKSHTLFKTEEGRKKILRIYGLDKCVCRICK